MAELDDVLNQPSESEQRIKQLSGKVREEAEAKEAALREVEIAKTAAQEANRLASFSEGFVDIVAEMPSAKDLRDEVKAKVLGGMSMDDAKIWLRGKTNTPAAPEAPASPAGGSASFTPPSQERKPSAQMSQADRRQALLDAETRGDLSWQ